MARLLQRRYSTGIAYLCNTAIVLLGMSLVAGALLTVRYLRLPTAGTRGVASAVDR